MKLEYEFGYVATLNAPFVVGEGPYGTRMIYEVTGGSVRGERINGKMLSGGADWLLVGSDGWGRLDVRGQMMTDDGAVLYVRYHGVLEMNERVQQAIAAPDVGQTDYADHYFRTTPWIEAGDPRYAWVNHTVFVAEGRVRPGPAVEYRVYRVE